MLPMLTTQEFLNQRFELPDAGQWAELIEGVAVCLQPPDLDHGTVILNLSKALATFIERTEFGYACFDLGLWLRREPDTIRFPAVSYFIGGALFAESDEDVTETKPVLVVELASTADRRKQMPERVRQYFDWGVGGVWVIDSRAQRVEIFQGNGGSQELSEADLLTGEPLLPGFEMSVRQLFAEPEWWR